MPDYKLGGQSKPAGEEDVTRRDSEVLFLSAGNSAFRPKTRVWPGPVLTCCS